MAAPNAERDSPPPHDHREAERLFGPLFAQFPEGLIIIDADGSFIDFNEAAHRHLGYSREEFARLRISDIDPEQTLEEIQASIKEVLERGSASFEVTHRTKGGEIRDVQVITRRITLSGRVAFCTIWHDITERKRAEEALREVAERYRDLFENANDAIFIVDADANYLDVNRRATEILGYSRDEFLTMSIRDLIPPDQVAASDRELRKLREQGGYERFVGKARTKDGRCLDVEVSSSAIVKNGRLVGSRDIVRDITERKQAEDALRASENLLQTIIETEPECVKLLDRDGRLLMMNRAGLSMVEADSFDEIKGKPVYPLIAPEFRDAFRKQVEAVFEGVGGMLEFDLTGMKGGRLRLETHAVPLRDDRGEISAVLGITRDVTERRRLEDELIRAQKLESIGLLAGGIAHDFNNLLAAILGNISLAGRDVGSSQVASRSLREAEAACARARDLTLQLLTFARGGAPVKTTTAIGAVVREAARFAVRGSAARCDVRIADDLRPVDVDEGQMSQVIQNLVINADQSMPEGGSISIACENVAVSDTSGGGRLLAPGDYIRIAVKDQGVGIPKAHLARAFDPYFTTKQKGSGLGLTICHSIVKRHDGHISVESEPGVGTTFSVFLPASEHQEPEPAPEQQGVVRGSGRILVMDDDAMVREVASAMLRSLGYEVTVAADGAAAIQLFGAANAAGEPFDAVITDLTVPGGIGGKEAVRQLSAIDPSVPVIVSSGYSNDPIVAEYGRHGFAGVLSKPYTVASLSRAVDAVLSPSARRGVRGP